METSTSIQNPFEIVRSIVGADKVMSPVMAERFGNSFWCDGNEYSRTQTRVFIPLPEGGVRELVDIIGVSTIVLPNGALQKSHYGTVRLEDVPSNAIVAQSLCFNYGDGLRQGWVITIIGYGHMCGNIYGHPLSFEDNPWGI